LHPPRRRAVALAELVVPQLLEDQHAQVSVQGVGGAGGVQRALRRRVRAVPAHRQHVPRALAGAEALLRDRDRAARQGSEHEPVAVESFWQQWSAPGGFVAYNHVTGKLVMVRQPTELEDVAPASEGA
ncbi:unnamed protein product, partial [Prorocentrum cordatum]